MATTSNQDSAPDASAAPSRRSRRSDGTARGASRSRRPRVSGDDLVNNLAEMVDQLVKENRELKRAIARAERTPGGGGLGQSTRVLSALQRRVSRALSAETGRGRRRAAEPAAPARPRRKVTDPEVLERRRQALAKARAARAAKRQQAAAAANT